MRRAIVARDQGCRFPGCDRPPGWCDAHHVVPWHPDGTTERDNLILLCDHHHKVVHNRGWTIDFDGHTLTVTRPDGTVEVTRAERCQAGMQAAVDARGSGR